MDIKENAQLEDYTSIRFYFDCQVAEIFLIRSDSIVLLVPHTWIWLDYTKCSASINMLGIDEFY